MRFLLFLLIGTLIFGFAFPAMIFIIGFIGLLICAVIVYKFLTGQSFRVYTSRDFSPPEDEGPSSRRMVYTEDDPEVVSHGRRNPDAVNVAADEEEIEEASEIIELPATALRKDDESEETVK